MRLTLSRKHLFFALFVVVAAAFLWAFFSGFAIADVDKGYDSYRFVDHALGSCAAAYEEACNDKIVLLLRSLGDNVVSLYLMFCLLVFALCFLSINSYAAKCFSCSIPLLLYFLGQPGKDVFTVLGTMGVFSILLSLSRLRSIPLRCKGRLRLSALSRYFFALSVISLSLYLRPQALLWYLVFALLFLADGFASLPYARSIRLKLFAALLSCLFALLVSIVLSSSPVFSETGYFDSGFASSSSFSSLVGFSPLAYALRVLFLPLYFCLYPLGLAFRSLDGYQILLSVCVLVQLIVFVLATRSGILSSRFYLNIFVLSAIVAAYPFPNIRYFSVFVPSLLALACHRRMSIFPFFRPSHI